MDKQIIRTVMRRATLQTRQPRLCLPILERFFARLEDGETPPAIKVCRGVIVDGNHRYVAGMVFGKLPDTLEWLERTNPPRIVPWDQVELDPVDWEA